ncbi:hypothetical protein B0H65DRAFT_473004 [Neurospora tetraspora]|uniref:Uncharacterized protein n=1 Tax=Neurospora tetraspora TaxID=94610 RepID=A0AAE0JBH1_9PEZI|nr:hypothetical protein B0H65DRAFT_473004 [Neurospora tetraspora]
MATDELGVFCLAFLRRDEGETAEAGEGALFRVRKVNTNNNRSGGKGRYSDGYGYNKDSLYDDGSFESGGVSPEGAHVSMSFPDMQQQINKLMPDAEDLRLALASYHVEGTIQTVYDCPVTLTPSHENDAEVDAELLDPSNLDSTTPQPPLLTAIPLPLSWQMLIEREPPPPSSGPGHQTLATRPPLADVTLPPTLTTHFLLTALDGLLASGCVGFTLGILGTSFPFLPMIANAALIGKLGLHCVFVICMFWIDAFTDDDDDEVDESSRGRRWANRWKKGTDAQKGGIWQATNGQLHGLNLSIGGAIWDVLHIAMVVLYTVALVLPIDGRKRRPRDLDKALIGWSVLGHLFSMMVKLVVREYVLGPLLLDRYLASFEDDSATAHSQPRQSFQWNEKGALMVEVRQVSEVSHVQNGSENGYDVRDHLPSHGHRQGQGQGQEEDDLMVYEEWDRARGQERPRKKEHEGNDDGQEKSSRRRNRLFGGMLRRSKALRWKSTKRQSPPSEDSDNISNVAVVGQGDDDQHDANWGHSEVCLLAELEG